MTRAPQTEAQIRKKIESLVKQERTLYEKAGFKRNHIVVFPQGKVPLIGRIGTWLIRWAKGTIQVEYIAIKPKK